MQWRLGLVGLLAEVGESRPRTLYRRRTCAVRRHLSQTRTWDEADLQRKRETITEKGDSMRIVIVITTIMYINTIVTTAYVLGGQDSAPAP